MDFFIVRTSTMWEKLFPLEDAIAKNCSKILIEEVLLRYGLPKRLITDNST